MYRLCVLSLLFMSSSVFGMAHIVRQSARLMAVSSRSTNVPVSFKRYANFRDPQEALLRKCPFYCITQEECDRKIERAIKRVNAANRTEDNSLQRWNTMSYIHEAIREAGCKGNREKVAQYANVVMIEIIR